MTRAERNDTVNPIGAAAAAFDNVDLTLSNTADTWHARYRARIRSRRDLRRRIAKWETFLTELKEAPARVIIEDAAARARVRSTLADLQNEARLHKAWLRRRIVLAWLRIALPYILGTLAVICVLALVAYGIARLPDLAALLQSDPATSSYPPGPPQPTSATPGGHPMQGSAP